STAWSGLPGSAYAFHLQPAAGMTSRRAYFLKILYHLLISSMEPQTRSCQNCNKDFAIDAADFDFYKKISVPPPTFCPLCRLRRRYGFRNERTLFKRRDDASGKDIISGLPQDVKFPVYERDYWWSDAWDVSGYSRDF